LFASDGAAIVVCMSTVAPSAAPARQPRLQGQARLLAPPSRPHLHLVPPPVRPAPTRPAELARGAAALCGGLAIGFALAGAVQQPFGRGGTLLLVALLAALAAGAAWLAARSLSPSHRPRPSRR
jgi:predicted lipid-binding transport protein (Tim44 family)